MKRNNKALYELIMRNVSKEVKKTLNENQNDDVNPFSWITKIISYHNNKHSGVRSEKYEKEEIVSLIFDAFSSPEKFLELDNNVLATYIKNAILSGLKVENSQDDESDSEIQHIFNLAKQYKPGETEVEFDCYVSVNLYSGYDPDDFDIDYYEDVDVEKVKINIETNVIEVYLTGYDYEGDGWYDIDDLSYEDDSDKYGLITSIEYELERLVDEMD